MHVTHRGYAVAVATAIWVAGVGAAPAPVQPPKRIVSAFLCTDEYVFRLVPRERIAALSYLAADRQPVVSTIAREAKGIPGIRASAEQMLALHPDLVVTYENTNVRQTQLLRAAGVKVLEVPWAQSLTDVRRITRMLGARFGARARAEALIRRMDSELAKARPEVSRPPVRTLIYEPNGYATGGGVTDEILSAAGLQNIGMGAHVTRSGTLPVEAVLSLAPDLMIFNGEHVGQPARADLILKHPALAALGGRTRMVRTSLVPLLCPGPWSADVAIPLAKLARATQKTKAVRAQ
jgi:iron complex transport system substrate-binding protein